MAYQDAFRNGARRTPLLDDDLRGFISDGTTGSLSIGQVVETILGRIGASDKKDAAWTGKKSEEAVR